MAQQYRSATASRATIRLILVSLLLLSMGLAACGASATQSRSAGAQVAQKATTGEATVKITAKEFSYTFDNPTANAGTITFVIQNAGVMDHDFAIQGNGVEQKTPLIKPGQSATFKVTLSPGAYAYKCTVPGHDILGMKGTFTVNEPSQ